MNQALRWMLILGCLMLAVLEAPRSSALMAEDLAGPYPEPQLSQAELVKPAPLPLLAGAQLASSEEIFTGAGTK
jgi:hypothetical protein